MADAHNPLNRLSPVYLDHAAATPLLPQVAAMHARLCQQFFANPHAATSLSEDARRAIDVAGRRFLELLGIAEDEAQVIWTSGGTESVNLGCLGALRGRRPPVLGLVDPAAHASVLEASREGVGAPERCLALSLDSRGRFDLEKPVPAGSADAALLAVCHVNNETGAVHDLVRLRQWMVGGAPKAALMVDAIQSFGKMDIPWRAARIDLLAVSGRKIGGPPSVGVLVRRRGVQLQPLFFGGGQQDGLRPGTVDVVGVLEFVEAAALACGERASEWTRVTGLNRRLREGLATLGRTCQPQCHSPEDASPYILSVAFPGCEGEVLARLVELENVIVGTGSACSARSGKSSHVLAAMGVPAPVSRSTLRFSFGPSTTEHDIDRLMCALRTALAKY